MGKPKTLVDTAREMQKIRSAQPLRTSEKMREQLETNRSSYADRPQSPSAMPSSNGHKAAV